MATIDGVPGLYHSAAEIEYMLSVLKGLGVKGLSTLSDRIIAQKTTYLAQRIKLIQPYSYNLYIHGPYSPNLSSDLYKVIHLYSNINEVAFGTNDLREKFVKLKKWMVDKKPLDLEHIATYDWFKTLESNEIDVIKKVKKTKSIDDGRIKWCREELEKLGL